MHTFKHTAPAGDPRLATTGNLDAGLPTTEAELAAIGVGDGFHRVVEYLFATVVYGLSLLIATPFFAVLFAPFYMGNF